MNKQLTARLLQTRLSRLVRGTWRRTRAEYLTAAAGLTLAFASLVALGSIADQRETAAAAPSRPAASQPRSQIIPSLSAPARDVYFVVASRDQASRLSEQLQLAAQLPRTTGTTHVLVVESLPAETVLRALTDEAMYLYGLNPLEAPLIIDMR